MSDVKFFSLRDILANSQRTNTYFTDEDVARFIAFAQKHHSDCFRVVERGLSPQGRPILELRISHPRPTPKNMIVANVDPHPLDERQSMAAFFDLGRRILTSRERLKGRELRILIANPDQLAEASNRLPSRVALSSNPEQEWARLVGMRDPRRSHQSGWSSHLPEETSKGSAGWQAVRAMLHDSCEDVRENGGTLMFFSGHNSIIDTGTQFHIGGPNATAVGQNLEAMCRHIGEPLTDYVMDGSHLPRIPGTRFSFADDTAAARRVRGCTDVELAHFLAERSGISVTTLVAEIPAALFTLRDKDQEVMRRQTKKLNRAAAATIRMLRGSLVNLGYKNAEIDRLDVWYEGTKNWTMPKLRSRYEPDPSPERRAEIAVVRGIWAARALQSMQYKLPPPVKAPPQVWECGHLEHSKLHAHELSIRRLVFDLCETITRDPSRTISTTVAVIETAFAASLGTEMRLDCSFDRGANISLTGIAL